MDAFDYLESRDDADELIAEFGRDVSLRRVTNSGTDWEPTQTATDHATQAAKIEFTWQQRQDSNVLATDQRWLVAAGPLAALGVTDIKADDRLLVDSVAFQIVKATPLNPAGTAVLYDCQVRA